MRYFDNLNNSRRSIIPATVLLFFAILAAAIPPQTVRATIMQYLEIEDLTRFSTDVFHGKVIGVEAHWSEGRTSIVTAVRVQVLESFKGPARRLAVVTIEQPGGEKDGIRMDYDGRPVFRPGEMVVVFASRVRSGALTVTGLKQGKLTVEGSEARRDFSGVTLLGRDARDGRLRVISNQPRSLPMDELRTRLMRAR